MRISARDVLGRELLVPPDWQGDRPYPVAYLYELLPTSATWQWEEARRTAFLAARSEELAAIESKTSDDVVDRLVAFSHAMRHYQDPGPALAVGRQTAEVGTGRERAAEVEKAGEILSLARLDTNANGSLIDEVAVMNGAAHPLRLRKLTGNDSAVKSVGILAAMSRHGAANASASEADGAGRLQNGVQYQVWVARVRDATLLSGAQSLWEPEPPPSIEREPVDVHGIEGHHPLAVAATIYSRILEIDGPERKSHLREIAHMCGECVDQITSVYDALNSSEMEVADQLIGDACYRRGRALGYMELPSLRPKNLIADHAAHDEAFEENYRQLSTVADTTSPRYALLTVRKLRRDGKFASALRLVQMLSEHVTAGSPADFWYAKKRRDLYENLGWAAWRDYEQQWMWRKFPAWTYALEYGSSSR